MKVIKLKFHTCFCVLLKNAHKNLKVNLKVGIANHTINDISYMFILVSCHILLLFWIGTIFGCIVT